MSISFLGEWPRGDSALDWTLVKLLRSDLEGLSALTAYKRYAGDAADPVAAELFGQMEQRLRAEVCQVQDLLDRRKRACALPPDFEMPTCADDVDN